MSTASRAAACRTMAGLYLRLLIRSRAPWIGAFFAIIPAAVAFIAAETSSEDPWRAALAASESLVALVPAIFASGIIADEMADQTYTYLFSRPVPRWTLYVGKLVAAIATSMVVVVGSAIAAAVVAKQFTDIGSAIAGLALGSAVMSAIAASLGTLVPRHPIVAAIVYVLLIDVPLAHIPFDARFVTVTFHVSELTGRGDIDVPVWLSLLWLGGMAALWTTLASWRLSRLEGSVAE